MLALRVPSETVATRAIAGALLIFGIAGMARSVQLGLTELSGVGVGAISFAVFAVITVCAVWIVIRPPLHHVMTETAPRSEPGHEIIQTLNPVIVGVAATFGYLILMPLAGYIAATALFSVLLSRYAGSRWVASIVVGTLLSLASYALFDIALQLNLPQGFWE